MYYEDRENQHHTSQNSVGEVDMPEPHKQGGHTVNRERTPKTEDTQEFAVDFSDLYEQPEYERIEDCFGYGDHM